MTCIVGIVHKKKVFIGADSLGSNRIWQKTLRKDPKVFKNGDFLIGYTSSFRMGQLLRFNFQPPVHPLKMDDYEYMVKLFIPAVRECFKDGGFAEKDKEQESGGIFLVGYRGELYCVESDYQVGVSYDGFDSVGCGDDLAKGALFVNKNKHPKERIRQAIEAAAHFSAGVGGDIIIREI